MSLKETVTPYDGGGEGVDEVLEKLEIYRTAYGSATTGHRGLPNQIAPQREPMLQTGSGLTRDFPR